jgi:hypothetical protein
VCVHCTVQGSVLGHFLAGPADTIWAQTVVCETKLFVCIVRFRKAFFAFIAADTLKFILWTQTGVCGSRLCAETGVDSVQYLMQSLM